MTYKSAIKVIIIGGGQDQVLELLYIQMLDTDTYMTFKYKQYMHSINYICLENG